MAVKDAENLRKQYKKSVADVSRTKSSLASSERQRSSKPEKYEAAEAEWKAARDAHESVRTYPSFPNLNSFFVMNNN